MHVNKLHYLFLLWMTVICLEIASTLAHGNSTFNSNNSTASRTANEYWLNRNKKQSQANSNHAEEEIVEDKVHNAEYNNSNNITWTSSGCQNSTLDQMVKFDYSSSVIENGKVLLLV